MKKKTNFEKLDFVSPFHYRIFVVENEVTFSEVIQARGEPTEGGILEHWQRTWRNGWTIEAEVVEKKEKSLVLAK